MQIGSNHPSPRSLRQCRKDQPYWPLPNYQPVLSRLQTKRLNTFDAGIHRLNKTCLFEADAVRDANRPPLDNPVHYPDVFRKPSTRRLEPSCATDFLVGGALRKGFVAAVIKFSTGEKSKNHHAFAAAQLPNAIPHFRRAPSTFFAKN